MNLKNYFLLRNPGYSPSNQSIQKTPNDGEPGAIDRMGGNASKNKVGNGRIAVSLIGLIIGIFLSFIVTGLSKSQPKSTIAQEVKSKNQTENNQSSVYSPSVKTIQWDDLWKFGLITFVVCMLSYPGLYSSLKLYVNEPVFLILFISFQYGFFWQSVIKAGISLI